MKELLARGSWVLTIPMAALAVAYVTFGYLPGERAIADMEEQLQQQQQYLDQAKHTGAALVATQTELEKAQRFRQRWTRHAVTERNVGAVYEQIQLLAQAAGVRITHFDPLRTVDHASLAEIPLALSCSGTFADTFDFLRRVESLPQTIWEKRVRIEKMDSDREDVACHVELVIFAVQPENSDYDPPAI
jgi:Tfp pilus assembly protein PilO